MAAAAVGLDRRPDAPAGLQKGAGWQADELPDGLVVADADGLVVVFNRAAARITGRPAADVLGTPIEEALPLETLDGKRWWQCTDPYGGLATRTRQPERSLLLPPVGELLVTASYVRGDDAAGSSGDQRSVTKLVVCLRDTVGRERLERGRADLVSTVAHELRSPLTSVKGFTATLLSKWDRFTDEQKRLMLETVDSDADRVTRLITELLDVSRIDAGRVEVRRQLVDLPLAARRVVDGFVGAGKDADRFRVVARDGLPDMWVDADKLDQVLGNLIENAVVHGDGQVTVTIEPAVTAWGPGANVAVSDEGTGIPADVASRVFTKFWRSGRHGGTGLGLYIVRGLVEAHGGTITAERAPEGGALFRLTLPAATPELLR